MTSSRVMFHQREIILFFHISPAFVVFLNDLVRCMSGDRVSMTTTNVQAWSVGIVHSTGDDFRLEHIVLFLAHDVFSFLEPALPPGIVALSKESSIFGYCHAVETACGDHADVW